MKLATARRLAAHTSVAFAFLSITTGGEIPVPIVGAFFVLLVVSFFFGEAIGRGRAGLFTGITAATMLLLAGLVLAGQMDVVIAASLFAASLAINRLFARQSSADDGLLYLGALMMLAGGAALSAEVLYGVFFIGFALSTTAGLTLSHLSRVVEDAAVPARIADRLAAPRLMLGLGALSVVAVIGSLLVFFLFPRVTTNLMARKAPRGLGNPTTGFTDQIKLGGHGTLKTDTRVVLRIKADPDPGTVELDQMWKGKSFDLYDGRGWRSTGVGSGAVMRLQLAQEPRQSTTYEVEVLPASGATAVFTTGVPWMVERPRRIPPIPMAGPLTIARD
ncbi:MAG: DUF3488 domain-containing protein, partial [Myxococcales bacterium]